MPTADPYKLPGRYAVEPVEDAEYPWYWHAFVGDDRVNGGVASSYYEGTVRARHAMDQFRVSYLREYFFWDVETCAWYPKEELALYYP